MQEHAGRLLRAHIGYRASEHLLASKRIVDVSINAFEESAFFPRAKALSRAQRRADRIRLEQDGSTATMPIASRSSDDALRIYEP